MLTILKMRPDQGVDPVVLRDRQNEIRQGFPAFILHPLVDEDSIRAIGGSTLFLTKMFCSLTCSE